MRWNNLKGGEKRVRSWFAILPVTIDYETRWLEHVIVIQLYETFRYMCRPKWINLSFCNIKKNKQEK